MSPACSRSWQAEAIEDGRLTGSERESFERHAQSCDHCAGELKALAELRELSTRLPAIESAPLERRRLRNKILAKANERVLRRPTPMLRVALAAASVVLLGGATAAGVVAYKARQPAPQTQIASSDPTYQITPFQGGNWHIERGGPQLRLAVGAGSFAIKVDKLHPEQRFVLGLPDGELEVKGTQFVVDVDATSTRRVAVSEGLVVLRLRDRGEVAVSAGEFWPGAIASASEPRCPASAEAAASAEVANPSAPRGAEPPRNFAVPIHVQGSSEVGASSSAAATAPAAPSAGQDFAAAMAAFSSGDYATAEQLFSVFEARHPRDGRVEDVCFLRAVARSRRGDAQGAKAAALEYLRRYPSGLRKLEAERLAK